MAQPNEPVVEEAREIRQITPDTEEKTRSLLELAKDGEDGEKKVAARITRWWTQQNQWHNLLQAEWRVNKARRSGLSNVKLMKSDIDVHDYDIYAPPNVNVMPHSLNKPDRLCRRVNSFIFTDPPMPEGIPARNDDEAIDAAEIATRVLQVQTSEGKLDDMRHARRAFDLACNYDSGFRHHYVDPKGGGQRPIQVRCHPMAVDLSHALPKPVNPQTNTPYPGPYVTKYVLENGQLTDDRLAEGLRLQFFPALKTEVLTGKNVRLLPMSANDIWDADGVMIGSFNRLGDLKERFPKIEELDEDELEETFRDPPDNVQKILPANLKRNLQDQELNDDALIFTLTHYRKAGGTEPQGVYAVVLGRDFLAHIQPWVNPRTKESMDIPVDQIKHFENEDSGYGRGLMRQLGGGGELLAMGFEAVISHMQRLKNRRVFIPTNSIIQAKQLQSSTGTAIPMNPGGKPEYEDVPPIPNQYMSFIEMVTAELNDESGLQEVAQGVNTPSVQSGLHARQIIEQSIVALSDLRQNTERALIRGYRIYLQLMKAYFSQSQELQVGDDNDYKVLRWKGADFQDTSDVRISKGSFTQLSPPAKAAEAERMFSMVDEQGNRLISLPELRNLILGNVGGLIGLQDDVYRNRVREQLKAWEDGPPPEFMPIYQQRQQTIQQLQAQVQQAMQQVPPEAQPAFQQQAQQLMQQALAQLPPLPTPFTPLPVDEEREVAATRHFEIARFMVRGKAASKPPPWIEVLHTEYQRMRQAAGIQTVAEQQQAMQAQQQAEQQAQQAQVQEKQQDQQHQLALKQQEAQGDILTAREQARANAVPDIKVSLDGQDFLAAAERPGV